jgi:hypothetical protein
MKPYRLQEPKMPLFFKLWFAFIAILVVSTFAATGYVLVSIAQMGPEGIGRAVGSIIGSAEKGFDQGRK